MSQAREPPAALKRRDDGIRVLIVDRSTPFRDTIRRVLDNHANCMIVGEASDLPEAVSLATERLPHLALLDFDLVANDKVGRVRRLAEALPSLQVVVLLTEYSQDYRQAVQVRWGYKCMAKDRVEEHLASVIADIRPTLA